MAGHCVRQGRCGGQGVLQADRVTWIGQDADRGPVRTPVVGRFGMAVAAWYADGSFRGNALWERVLGGADSNRLFDPGSSEGLRFRLMMTLDREPVPIALTGNGRGHRWIELAAPELAGTSLAVQQTALAFVPSRSPGFARLVTEAWQLGPRDKETFTHLLSSRDLNQLGSRLGLSRAGARKRVEALYRATHVTGLAELVATSVRWLGDGFAASGAMTEALQIVLGLTRAEARTGALLADGLSVPEAAEELRLSAHTVRDHARAALLKAGSARLKDFARTAQEVAALYVLSTRDLQQAKDAEALLRATRLMRVGGRQIGFADYGPVTGQPLLVCHGGMGMRRLGPALCQALWRQGFRPIVVERPGFGLSDPGSPERHFQTAAADIASVLERLSIPAAVLLAFDGGAASAIHFASSNPDRITAAMLVTPRGPSMARGRSRLVDRVVNAAMRRPEFIASWWRILRAQASPRLVKRLAERLFATHPADRACLHDDRFLHELTATLLSCGARTAEGIAHEQLAYQTWRPEPAAAVIPWAIMSSDHDPLWGPGAVDMTDHNPWSVLEPRRYLRLTDAGRFLPTTHAEPIADALASFVSDVGSARPLRTPSPPVRMR